VASALKQHRTSQTAQPRKLFDFANYVANNAVSLLGRDSRSFMISRYLFQKVIGYGNQDG
jgi:hypothetical protein